ncbi:dihydrofolate synthase [Sesbania bispinosa]|nr:dihydrofolate synthase [Sesbania bispinosa]
MNNEPPRLITTIAPRHDHHTSPLPLRRKGKVTTLPCDGALKEEERWGRDSPGRWTRDARIVERWRLEGTEGGMVMVAGQIWFWVERLGC